MFLCLNVCFQKACVGDPLPARGAAVGSKGAAVRDPLPARSRLHDGRGGTGPEQLQEVQVEKRNLSARRRHRHRRRRMFLKHDFLQKKQKQTQIARALCFEKSFKTTLLSISQCIIINIVACFLYSFA